MNSSMNNKKIGEFYDTHIQDRYDGDYEFNRWHTIERLRSDFYMNYKSIATHIGNINFNSCLELGPGPGTWTRVLYKHSPEAHYDLVDISKAMEKQFQLEMRASANVNYHVSDIMSFSTEKKYDLFFSSRAVEYLDNKSSFLRKIFSVMESGGKGVIITKNSSFGIRKGKDSRFQHQGQLSQLEFEKLLRDTGFKNIRTYPVIIRLPIIDRLTSKFSEIIFEKIYKNESKSSFLTKFTESYMLTFEK